MSERPPTRESIASDMSEILRYYHDAYGISPITEISLRNSITSLTMFFFKETDSKETVPYQYKHENQKIFEEHQVIISSALNMVEPVITDIKKQNFPMEKNQQTIMMPNAEPINVPKQEEKSKRNFSLFPQKQQKPIMNPNDPYQSSIAVQKKILKLIDDWELVVAWQSGGAEFVDIGGDHDLDRYGFDNYLSTHRQIVRSVVSPNLLRVYSQGLNLLLLQEKTFALQYGNNIMKEIFQTRNDLPHF